MVERPAKAFRSGDALFVFDPDLTVVWWNRAEEELTGVSADDAVGRHCWEVLGGRDASGNIVCHPGCSIARLAREDWPVSCDGLLIKAREGKRLAALDSAVLVATAHGALTGNPALVPLLLPTYSSLFPVLVATLAVFAERRLVSWRLAGGVLLAGPLAATVALDLCRPGRAAP